MKHAFVFIALLLLAASIKAQDNMQEVTINPGDTMWDIANRYLKDPQKWPAIVESNQRMTADPTLPLPGTRIKIPVTLIKEEYRTAQLIQFTAEVLYKRKTDSDFKPVIPDMTLRYEDSLRTMKSAQARVRFPTKEVIQINENSYVVLKPEKIMQEVQLLQGDIKASRAKVIMPGGTVVKPQGNNSEYQAKIRDDDSEVVFVYKGEVNVTAQGKTVKVKEGFGTHVPKAAPPIDPKPLAEFKDFNPAELSPETAQRLLKTSSSKPITFTPPAAGPKPTPTPAATTGKSKTVVSQNILVNYHVQVAKDQRFQQIVLEKTAGTAEPFDINKASIPDGNYFMRVAFLDALGAQGSYSEPTLITKDTDAPKLTDIKPAEGQTFPESNCDVSGIAQGAVLVSVNGQVVFLGPDGRFSSTAFLKEGTNQVHIVARDANGNETLIKRTVSYKKK